MKSYRHLHDIRANVTARWNHKNCKFQRGDYAEVTSQVLPRQYVKMDGGIGDGHSHVSQIKQRRVGQVGRVIAVSCINDGSRRIRGDGRRHFRQFTRYYVQFKDGVIHGFDSHHLSMAFSLASLAGYPDQHNQVDFGTSME